jgi:hypothetical protein
MAYPSVPYRGLPGLGTIGIATAIISDIAVELDDVNGTIDYAVALTQTIDVIVELT